MTVLSPGDRFAGYVVDGVLGRGGRATVYRAHDVAGPDRLVALKVLDPEQRTPVHLERLQREYEFAYRLDHPHVVTVYAAGDGWLTMELLGGGPVTNLRRLTDRLTALVQIAEALDHTHRQGIVHCDVKPSNILVAADFARYGAVLTDFGVAHAVSEFIRVEGGGISRRVVPLEASLPYTAPELFTGRPPAAASDQYSLACTAVELITGSPPFTAKTQMGLIDRHLHHPPPAVSRRHDRVPRAVDSILGRALAKLPEARYESCSKFASLIARAVC